MVEQIGESASRPERPCRLGIAYPRVMLLPSGLEVAVARGVGGLSRLAGRAAGRRFPASFSATLDPGAIDRLAARLPGGCVVVSATNGKTTSTAMAAEILRPRAGSRTTPPARTSSRASPPPSSRPTAPSSGCSRSTRARCRSCPPAAAARAVSRKPLPRPARPVRRARARRRALAQRCRRASGRSQLVFNADDPQLAAIGTARRGECRVRARRSARGA